MFLVILSLCTPLLFLSNCVSFFLPPTFSFPFKLQELLGTGKLMLHNPSEADVYQR